MADNTKVVTKSFTDLKFDRVNDRFFNEWLWMDAHANFLSSLSIAETNELLKFSRKINLKSGDQLFQAGDRSDDVYIVSGGCIRLFQVTATGKKTIVWFSFPGEIFGIAEMWSGGERDIFAEANEASEVYSIGRSDFSQFLAMHPEVSIRAIGILSARVRALGHALVGIATENVEKRIARLLLKFASVSSITPCSVGEFNDELCVNVRLTHQDIANVIGASRQTVTSTLMDFRKRGTVRMVNQHVHILQPKHLQRLLELSET